jgi:hypothetical protein
VPQNDPEITFDAIGTTLDELSLAIMLVAEEGRMRTVEFSNIALAAAAIVLVSIVLLVVAF